MTTSANRIRNGKPGRPKWIPDASTIAKVEAFAARGLTLKQIALALGIGVNTLGERKKTMRELAEAIERGAAKGIGAVTNALYEKALNGDTTAQIFFLKNRDPNNWHEKRTLEMTGPGGGPMRHEIIPAAQCEEILKNLGYSGYEDEGMEPEGTPEAGAAGSDPAPEGTEEGE